MAAGQISVSVKKGDMDALFQEVSGLCKEFQQIQYLDGNSKTLSTVKMPGIKKSANLTI